MFAKLKDEIRLEDLIQGVIVQSANDGCIIIAEGMAGSEENFARLMTERARKIGLKKSVFKKVRPLARRQHSLTKFSTFLESWELPINASVEYGAQSDNL